MLQARARPGSRKGTAVRRLGLAGETSSSSQGLSRTTEALKLSSARTRNVVDNLSKIGELSPQQVLLCVGYWYEWRNVSAQTGQLKKGSLAEFCASAPSEAVAVSSAELVDMGLHREGSQGKQQEHAYLLNICFNYLNYPVFSPQAYKVFTATSRLRITD